MFEGKSICVFDAEIKKRIEDCSKGWQSHDEMGVSVLVVFDYATMRYRVFDDNTSEEAIDLLWGCELCVGFNTVGFDWKLLKATYPNLILNNQPEPITQRVKGFGRRSGDFDILREIWISLRLNPDVFDPKTHGGYKLDDVAFETIGLRKTGDGAKAPVLFQEGRWAELCDYCVQDVKIEKELFEFAARYGYVIRNGQRIKLAEPTYVL